LDWDTTERELERRFKKFGEINGCVLIWNHKTNRSKGFGFVTYDDDISANDAVEEMNGTIIEGRKVRVDFSFTGTNAGVGARSRSRSPKKESRRSRRSRSKSGSKPRSRKSRSRSRSRKSRDNKDKKSG
jgi:transformer-2 protein